MQKISLNKKDKSLSLKTKVILIVIAALILAIGIGVFVFLRTYHVYESKVIAPTCETMGYTEATCIYCNDINRTHYVEALGHDYGEVEVKKEAKELEFGETSKTCERCGVEVTTGIEPTSTMKKLYYTGDIFSVDGDMVATGSMTFSNGGKQKKYYIQIEYIDDGLSKYVKHDYKVYFFKDENFSQETEVKLMDGVKASHVWELYGNYYDFYNLRDTVASELFCEVRKSSTAIDSRLKNNYLTKKSEPFLFFINESFAGHFRVLEPDGADTMNVKESDKMCAIVRATYNSNQSNFKQETDENGYWEVVYNYSDDNAWVYNSLNELVKFVNENEDEDFKKGISKHLDVDGMIDYMLTIYNIGAADNVGRCFTLATYDGKVWTPSVFDMNASLGLDNNGEISTLESILVPSIEDGEYISDTNSLLWDRMLESFYDEIKDRYNELKNTVFTPDNIFKKFKNHINEVPKSVYKKEKETYPVVDSETDLKQSITEFVAVRKNIFEVFFNE